MQQQAAFDFLVKLHIRKNPTVLLHWPFPVRLALLILMKVL